MTKIYSNKYIANIVTKMYFYFHLHCAGEGWFVMLSTYVVFVMTGFRPNAKTNKSNAIDYCHQLLLGAHSYFIILKDVSTWNNNILYILARNSG